MVIFNFFPLRWLVYLQQVKKKAKADDPIALFFSFVFLSFFLIQIRQGVMGGRLVDSIFAMGQAKDCPIFCVWRVF